MIHRIRTIVAFLVVGAIVNVTVAWVLTFAVDPTDMKWGGRVGEVNGAMWEGQCWKQLGAFSLTSNWTRHNSTRAGTIGSKLDEVVPAWSPSGRAPSSSLTSARPGAFEMDLVDARGWPWLSLLSWAQVRSAGVAEMNVLAGIECHWMPSRSAKQMFGHTLPTRPILPAFAINTVFYAAILWLLFVAPFALRRWRRSKRGLCLKCAYDLRGSNDASACPECGAAISVRSGRSPECSSHA